MYKQKKPKQMINGWRSDVADRLQAIIDKEVEAHGAAFTKAVLLDHIMGLGMDAFEGVQQSIESAKQIVKEKPASSRKRFVPPSVGDVYEYMLEACGDSQRAQDEAYKFVNYWSDVDWKRKGQKMSNWKGSAANWLKNNYGSRPAATVALSMEDEMRRLYPNLFANEAIDGKLIDSGALGHDES